jgi:MurNAc alpha-1-phosphate uridylyltransferase
VLAAGAGHRLRPLTAVRPKALCPVANRPLVDHAVERALALTSAVAVNVHHGRDALERHLATGARVHLSIEEPEALGTAGALGALAGWIEGRAVLVQNADAWTDADLGPFVDGWDGARVRLLVTPGPDGRARFGPGAGLVASLLPWSDVAGLTPTPSGLYEVVWRQAQAAGRLEAVAHAGAFVDCGTVRRYLQANLLAAAAAAAAGDGPGNRSSSLVDPAAHVSGTIDHSVIGAGAQVAGTVSGSVVWDGAEVGAGEVVVDAVRAGRLTVAVR